MRMASAFNTTTMPFSIRHELMTLSDRIGSTNPGQHVCGPAEGCLECQ